MNRDIAEVGLTHETCPLRQNHVIIHSGFLVAFTSAITLTATDVACHSLPEASMKKYNPFSMGCVGNRSQIC
jgi:hypothetical protein